MTKRSAAADRVWVGLVTLVMDTRQDWKRRIADATGLPFNRVRALRRLVDGPLALHALAEQMSCDAPAATNTVNFLEERGLVTREPHPTNRRVKLVYLTDAGSEVLARARAVTEHAPAAFAELPPAELAALQRVLDAITT